LELTMADSSVISITVTTKVTTTSFTGTINSQGVAGTGTTLTVTAGPGVCIGMILTGGSGGNSIQTGTIITAGSGNTWTVNIPQSITSTSITGTISTLNVISVPSGFGTYAGWLTGWSISGGSVTSSVIGQYITSSPNTTVAGFLPAYALSTTQITPVTTQSVTARYTDPLGTKSNVLQADGIFSGWITSKSSRDIIGVVTIDSPQTEENFLLPGKYSWYPSGSLTASMLCIGGGGGGSATVGGNGGGLSYVNNFVMGAGPYTVVVGVGGSANSAGGDTYILNNSYTLSGSDSIVFQRFQWAGQVLYAGTADLTTPTTNTTTWAVPTRFVSNISAAAIGGGGSGVIGAGGGGGALAYIGATSVTGGQTYTLGYGDGGKRGVASIVSVNGLYASGGFSGNGQPSYVKNPNNSNLIYAGGGVGLSSGGNIFFGSAGGIAGGGGAAQWNSTGGAGGSATASITGLNANGINFGTPSNKGGGGGTVTTGTGFAGGAGGYITKRTTQGGSVTADAITAATGNGGTAGSSSGLTGGGTYIYGGTTGAGTVTESPYGGGGGGNQNDAVGMAGAVRLIFGPNRAYPNTNTADQTAYLTNLTVPSTLAARLAVGMPIQFSFSIGSISANTTYYVYYLNGTDVQLVSDTTTSISS
jgi:hypothetical protein